MVIDSTVITFPFYGHKYFVVRSPSIPCACRVEKRSNLEFGVEAKCFAAFAVVTSVGGEGLGGGRGGSQSVGDLHTVFQWDGSGHVSGEVVHQVLGISLGSGSKLVHAPRVGMGHKGRGRQPNTNANETTLQ